MAIATWCLRMQARTRSGGALAGAGFITAMALAICSLHFTAMGALTLAPDPTVATAHLVIDKVLLAVFTTATAGVVLALGMIAAFADTRIVQVRTELTERLQRFVDAAFEGITIHDGAHILDANSRMSDLTGRSHAALIGAAVTDLFPDASQPLRDSLAGYSARSFETPLASTSKAIPVAVQTRPLGDGAHFITAVRDLRELVEGRSATAAAEAASAAKSDFLASMSHELRTPLNAIIGYSEMVEEDLADTDAAQSVSDAARIQSAARHLLALINQILDLSKIEAGRMEVNDQNVDFAAIVSDAVETIRPLVTARGNILSVICAPEIGSVVTDPMIVKQCMLNLVGNANKFTENGRIFVTADRERGEAGDAIVVRIRDTGIGMTREQAERLFQPFSQADKTIAQRFGGTGLGLVITRRLIELMAGTVSLQSTPGKGSTFTLRFPMHPVQTAVAA